MCIYSLADLETKIRYCNHEVDYRIRLHYMISHDSKYRFPGSKWEGTCEKCGTKIMRLLINDYRLNIPLEIRG
jgi:hypothetical protein